MGKCDVYRDCRIVARRGLGECVQRVEESLPNYFKWVLQGGTPSEMKLYYI